MKFHYLTLVAVILFVSLAFAGITASAEYDPFLDVDENGEIDILDVIELANYFGTSGTSINKTELLLELQKRIVILETDLASAMARLEALETRMPRRGCISISAAAFTTTLQGQNISYGYGLDEWAPVQLPDGVVVTNVTAFIIDRMDYEEVAIDLFGFNFTSNTLFGPMAHAYTSVAWASMSYAVVFDDMIECAQIDNKNCVYALHFQGTNTILSAVGGVVIEYEYPA